MGALIQIDVAPQSDADGIAQTQTPVGAGNLTINGALASDGAVSLGAAHIVTITSDGDDSGRIFTVTGTDSRDIEITEAITGPNATTVAGSKYFKTITQVAINLAGVGNITVGTNGECVSAWVPYNHGKRIDIGLGIILSTGAVLTYSVTHTWGNVNDKTVTDFNELEHNDLSSKGVSDDGNYGFSGLAYRLKITAFTSGSVSIDSSQAF